MSEMQKVCSEKSKEKRMGIPVRLMQELKTLALVFLYFACWLGILFLIPGINLAAPFLWGLFSAWMLAIEYADYPMANHMLRFPEQRKRLRRRRLLSWGFGGGSLLMGLLAAWFVRERRGLAAGGARGRMAPGG